MALATSGCADLAGKLAANPSPAQLATPERTRSVTAVAVSARCKLLARKVPAPPYKVGDDPKLVLKRYEAALAQANANIGATGECIGRLSAEYRSGL